MRELLYIEIPTPDIASVRHWLQDQWRPGIGKKVITPAGLRLQLGQTSATSVTAIPETAGQKIEELSVFVWSVQRTTYLKVFRWVDKPIPSEKSILQSLTAALRSRFPNHYPEPPAIDLSQKSIFEALAPYYPLTVKYFQKMPNGEYDLARVYWWEQRWREGVRNPQQPKQVIFSQIRIRRRDRGQGDRGAEEAGQTTSPTPQHPTPPLPMTLFTWVEL
jgi:lycopene cyclase CruA